MRQLHLQAARGFGQVAPARYAASWCPTRCRQQRARVAVRVASMEQTDTSQETVPLPVPLMETQSDINGPMVIAQVRPQQQGPPCLS